MFSKLRFSKTCFLCLLTLLTTILVVGVLSEEHQSQLNLVRYDNNEEQSSPEPWSSIISMIFILFATIIQLKAGMLWSESRILRKIHDRTHATLTSGIPETDTNTRFATIFKNLSKGRHRRLNRMFPHFFLFFTVALDLMFSLQYFLNASVIPTSEALTAVRALIYFGSFTVLGVRPLTWREMLAVSIIVVVQASSLTLFGLGKIPISRTAGIVFTTLRSFALLLFLLVEARRCWSTLHSKGDDISQLVNSILKNKLRDGSRQMKRLQEMYALARIEEAQDRKNGWQKKPYQRPNVSNWVEWGSLMLYALMNGPAWGKEDFSLLPTVVIIESLEMVSTFLLFINNTQVEPELFVQLLRIARIQDERYMV